MTYNHAQNDLIWKALSDGRRRLIVEALTAGPLRTSDLVDLFPDIGRTGVLKHIEILRKGGLVSIRRDGRTRWNSVNVEPIEEVCASWMVRHINGIKGSALKLKQIAEMETDE